MIILGQCFDSNFDDSQILIPLLVILKVKKIALKSKYQDSAYSADIDDF